MRTDLDDNKAAIIKALKSGVSRGAIARQYGCRYDTLTVRLKKWGCADLKNQGSRGIPQPNRKTSVEIYLVKSGPFITSHKLKLKLFESGLKARVCEWCRIDTWCGLPAPLELDHISGNHHDNRWENLRILCANCHALTATNSGKNKGKYAGVAQLV